MAAGTRRIGVEPVIRSVREERAVAVNVDGARTRPAPGEIHRVPSLHFVAPRGECDLARCGSRS